MRNARNFIAGYLRYWLFQFRLGRLVLKANTIREIRFRIFMQENNMTYNVEPLTGDMYFIRVRNMKLDSCYNRGSCRDCGCTMPQLLFAKKGCNAKCYPRFNFLKQDFLKSLISTVMNEELHGDKLSSNWVMKFMLSKENRIS